MSQHSQVDALSKGIDIDWRGRVIEATESDLAELKVDISKQTSASEKRRTAEAFLRAKETTQASEELATDLSEAFTATAKSTLLKSGVIA